MPLCVQSNSGSGTGTSLALAFSASNLATNLLVACVKTAVSGNAITISDTSGNTWLSAGYIDNASGGWRMQIWYAQCCLYYASTNTVTVKVASSAANVLSIAEYSGVSTAALSSIVSASGSGTAIDSGSLTVGIGNTLVGFGYCSAGGMTVGSGFTSRQTPSNTMLEDKSSTATTDTVSFTCTSGTWSVIAVSFTSATCTPSKLISRTSVASVFTAPSPNANIAGYANPVPVASALAGGTVGTAYSETISTQNGTSPYTYVLSSGSLPTGLTLTSSTGIISGTPTIAGTYTFSIRVTDLNGYAGSQSFSIDISAASIGSATANYGWIQ